MPERSSSALTSTWPADDLRRSPLLEKRSLARIEHCRLPWETKQSFSGRSVWLETSLEKNKPIKLDESDLKKKKLGFYFFVSSLIGSFRKHGFFQSLIALLDWIHDRLTSDPCRTGLEIEERQKPGTEQRLAANMKRSNKSRAVHGQHTLECNLNCRLKISRLRFLAPDVAWASAAVARPQVYS